MNDDLTERELKVMRKLAGCGSRYTPETIEDEHALATLRKKKFVSRGLTVEGWRVLRELDDDTWSD